MGRPFLIELDCSDDSNDEFYVCSSCQTHIASRQDFHFSYAPDDELPGVIFNKVVNVEVDESAQLQWVGPHLAADVHCKNCNDHLGWEFVEVSAAHPPIFETMVLLTWEKLLMGDGHHLTEA